MKIEITPLAKDRLEKANFDKENRYLLVSLVNMSCSGIALSLTASDGIDDAECYELEGNRILIKKDEADLFEEITIDYEPDGLQEGFTVTPGKSKIQGCFVAELAE